MSHPLSVAADLLAEGVEQLCAATGPAVGDDELLAGLRVCEGAVRRLDRTAVSVAAQLLTRGVFASRGYRHAAAALADMFGWDHATARRRVAVAEYVGARATLSGEPLVPRCPATAAVFAAGETTLRHVEVIVGALTGAAAGRLPGSVWAGVEAELAAKAAVFGPRELAGYARRLIDALDADGPTPDTADGAERPQRQTNELRLTPHVGRPGGRIDASYDDAAMYEAVAVALDALSAPTDGEDPRSLPERRAEALSELCATALDRGEVPERGGHRPTVNVLVRLEDLERRATAALLDFGDAVSPAALRLLCCDARVIPVVLGGAGQPLDVGRATRTVPDPIRRAVIARDRCCIGCGAPPARTECHHIEEWVADLGPTRVANLALVCRRCHRLLHHHGWSIEIIDGLPWVVPPAWVDPQRIPRRRTPPLLPTPG